MTCGSPLELVREETITLFHLNLHRPFTTVGAPVETNLPFNDLAYINRMISIQPARRMRSTMPLSNTWVRHLVTGRSVKTIPRWWDQCSLVTISKGTRVACWTVQFVKSFVIHTAIKYYNKKSFWIRKKFAGRRSEENTESVSIPLDLSVTVYSLVKSNLKTESKASPYLSHEVEIGGKGLVESMLF